MSRRTAKRRGEQGALVLANEALNRAATDRLMYARLKVAHLDGRRVVTSAAILAAALRGGTRDAAVHRVLGGVAIEEVTAGIGRQAGELIGAAGLNSAQAVGSMVAATALAQHGPVVIVTSDVPDLTALVGDHERIAVVHVDRSAGA